jgi:hypothetical protein
MRPQDAGHPLGQQVADTAPLADQPDHVDERLAVAEMGVDPVGVVGCDQPAFGEFHRQCDRVAGGNRVDADLVVVAPGRQAARA